MLLIFFLSVTTLARKPLEFVDLQTVTPDIIQEIRLAESHNFVGHPIVGFKKAKCILTREAAKALGEVEQEIKGMSLTLKVYDCYRPMKAVNFLVNWVKDKDDQKMKEEFYPKAVKSTLFQVGYLSSKSSHARGSAVDLTLVKLPVAKQETFSEEMKLKNCTLPQIQRFGDNSVDMGTGYACFDPLSYTTAPEVSADQRKNRFILKAIMEKHGFNNFAPEWWHYTFKHEPFTDKYFDFDVE